MEERRSKVRIQVACPAIVRGAHPIHGKFENEAILENLSASGLYLRLNRAVERGARLLVSFRLAKANDISNSPWIVARGEVVRVEPQPDSTCGLALKIERHRFI